MNKRIVSMLLVIILVISAALGLTACSDGADGVTPQLRINSETNFWEVSYDNGATWVSMDVKATGANGADGKDGVNGTDGADGKDAVAPQVQINSATNYWEVSYDNGVTWTSLEVKATGANGADGKDGKDGANGTNGANGSDGTNGSNGVSPTIGEDGYWYIGDVCTGIYAGSADTVTVTFVELGGMNSVEVPMGSKASYYAPESPVATFDNWYADEACTVRYDFNNIITEDTTVYSKWTYDETFVTVAELMESASFGKASCFGTTACFGSVYFRVLTDAHDYYDGAAGIANYLKGVFIEDENGNVSVNPSSSLRGISYTEPLTIINFASAFSSYNEYIIRNAMEMPEEIARQKELAVKYFETVDTSASNYHTHSGGGMSFPSPAVAVVVLGSLMEQTDTERFDTLIKDAYDNLDSAFYNSGMYLQPFYQLCAHYDWYDLSAIESEVAVLTSLSDSNVLKYYGYGIDLANDYSELWNAWEENALSDGALSTAEAKAFAYHYAYQLSSGEAWLGIYGSSRAIVDFSAVSG